MPRCRPFTGPVVLAVAVFFAGAAAAQGGGITEQRKGALLASLGRMAAGAATPADEVPWLELAGLPDPGPAAWRSLFAEHLEALPYVPALGAQWWRLISVPRPEQPSLARIAGCFHAVVLSQALASAPPGPGFDAALVWIEGVMASAPPLAVELRAGMEPMLKEKPLDLLAPAAPAVAPADAGAAAAPSAAVSPTAAVPGAGVPEERFAGPFAMQAAVTLGLLAGPEKVGDWIKAPTPSLRAYQTTGVWIFDDGLLPPPVFTSLQSLVSAAPQILTGMSAVVCLPYPVPLRAPGAVAAPPPAPWDAWTSPVALSPAVLPAVPLYTGAALRQTAEMIQAKELARRPELVQGCGELFGANMERTDSPFRQWLASAGVTGPGDFYAALGALWMVNSRLMLDAAATLFDAGEFEPVAAVLLVADLYSNGGDTTLLFQTNPAGVVSSQQAALRRAVLPSGRPYVTGVASGRGMLYFDLQELLTLLQ
ncbi:MAG TPA: hypothetical protein PKN23_08590 [Candidatus Hydrogenedentes bacterium]|nr:hypothetical protein [Candidatus Hydrogenedentota bacterium]